MSLRLFGSHGEVQASTDYKKIFRFWKIKIKNKNPQSKAKRHEEKKMAYQWGPMSCCDSRTGKPVLPELFRERSNRMGIRFLWLQLAIRSIKWLCSGAHSQKGKPLFGGKETMKMNVKYHHLKPWSWTWALYLPS